MTLEQVIKGCIKNDERSQKKLYDTYSGQMYSICLRYCHDAHTATDALQLSFIKIFRKIHTFNSSGNIKAWMSRVVVRTCLDEIKKFKRLQFEEVNESVKQIGGDIDHSDIDNDTYSELMAVVKKLPKGYQNVFCLKVIEGYSHSEIGELLGIKSETSRSQFHKARLLLKAMLENKKELLKH